MSLVPSDEIVLLSTLFSHFSKPFLEFLGYDCESRFFLSTCKKIDHDMKATIEEINGSILRV